MATLSDRQLTFAREYAIDKNGTQAAIRAGYGKAGARQQACRLLTNVHIQAEVSRLEARTLRKLNISAEWVLENIVAIVDEARRDNQHSAALKGMELLGRTLKLFTDKTEITSPGSGPIAITVDL